MAWATLDTGTGGVDLDLEYGSIVDDTTGGSVTETTTKGAVSYLRVQLRGGNAVSDSGNNLSVSGGAVDDKNYGSYNVSKSTGGNYPSSPISLVPQGVTLTYGSTSSENCTVEWSGIDYTGNLKGTRSFTYPRRPYRAPDIPNVNITSSTVTASGQQRDTSKDKYWENLTYWLSTNGNSYESIGTDVSGATTSRSYTSAPDSRYRGRARAKNGDNTGEYGYSGYYYTTPTMPTGFTAVRRSGSTTVDLDWTNPSNYGTIIVIERNLAGAGWVTLKNVSGTTTTDTVALGTTAQYRIKTKTEDASNGVPSVNSAESDWVTSGTISAGYVIPAVPTITSWQYLGGNVVATVSGNNDSSASTGWWQYLVTGLYTDGVWATDVQRAGTTTIISAPAALDSFYVFRAKSRNPVGDSAYRTSATIYAPPSPPTLNFSRAPNGGAIQVYSPTYGGTTTDIQLERSLEGSGGSWTLVGAYIAGDSLIDSTVPPGAAAWYRARSINPGPTPSEYSTVLACPAVLVTDISKIPGVTKLYNGTTRIRQVFVQDTRIWTDGTA